MNPITAPSLAGLFAAIPLSPLTPVPDVPVRGVVLDSRQVQPGYVFVAIRGGNTDGHRYIPDAVRRGAAAIVGTDALREVGAPYVQVRDARRALAYLAAAFHDFPAREMTVIGVTGTDGKTTTSTMIYHILRAAGLRAGMITTVAAFIGDRALDTGFHVTTPEAPDVQRYLAEMVAAGLTHVVLEATSHGLAQGRVAACEFDVAVVTNITHEHLDYHGSYEGYFAAKETLFREVIATPPKAHGQLGLGVLNRDDRSFDRLNALPLPRRIAYGRHPEADVRAVDVQHTPQGIAFRVVGQGLDFAVQCPLLGAYNVSNALAAVALTVAGMGLPVEAAQQGLASLPQVPGRMERIEMGQPFLAIVDFAHTPNALAQALRTARELTTGRVIAVFGSAGLRDRAKRRMMAEVSAELADLTVLTAEDPRTESLDDILAEMAAGAQMKGGVEGETFWRVPDRGEAIRFAVGLARPGDLVIACGKGHEQSMCFGTVEYPWDDRTAMRAALADLLGVDGPPMPRLPTSPPSQSSSRGGRR